MGTHHCLSVVLFLLLCRSAWTQQGDNYDLLDCPSVYENPRIYLWANNKRYSVDYKGETWEPYEDIKLECRASYPVEWDFEAYRPIDGRFRAEMNVDQVENTGKRCYNVSMNPYNWKSGTTRSGNYICRGLNDKNKRSSVYKFIQDSSSVLFNCMNNLNVTLEKGNSVVIPCAAMVPDLKASLKTVDAKENLMNVDPKISVKYDPKLGFTLESSNKTLLYGSYACVATLKSVTETINVAVVQEEPAPEAEYVALLNGKLSVHCHGMNSVNIKLVSQSHYPGLSILSRQYPTDSILYRFGASATVESINPFAKGELACYDEQSNKVLWTWRFDGEYTCNCKWTLPESSYPSQSEDLNGFHGYITDYGILNCSSTIPGVDLRYRYLRCDNPTECRMFTECGLKEKKPCQAAYSDSDYATNSEEKSVQLTSGKMFCTVGSFTSTQTVIAGLKNMYFDATPPINDSIRIYKPESEAYVGDKLAFACHASSYIYTHRLRWAFQYKNGTIQFLKSEIDLTKETEFYEHDPAKIQRKSFITLTSSDISGLVCFAPLWNSTKWHNVSVPLKIHDANPEVTVEQLCNDTLVTTPVLNLNRTIPPYSGIPDRAHVSINVTGIVLTTTNTVNDMEYIVCRAKFPIVMLRHSATHKHDNEEEDVQHGTLKKLSCPKVGSKVNYVYELSVSHYSHEIWSSGNFTCRGKRGNSHLKASVFVFTRDPNAKPKLITQDDSHGENYLEVFKYSDDVSDWVTIPCYSDDPEVKVYLFSINDDLDETILPLDGKLMYDPRSGFKVHESLLQSESTEFRCSLNKTLPSPGVQPEEDKDSSKYITVINKSGSAKSSSTNGISLNSFATLVVFTILFFVSLLVAVGLLYWKLKLCSFDLTTLRIKWEAEDKIEFSNRPSETAVQVENAVTEDYRRFS